MKRSFTLLELIFVIVIVGILASVAIPKFRDLISNSKVTTELTTAKNVQTAIELAHNEWIVSDCEFTWGNGRTTNCSDDDTSNDNGFNCSSGYPKELNSSNSPFGNILKGSVNDWVVDSDSHGIFFKGPASCNGAKTPKCKKIGVKENGENKPDLNDCWRYDDENGSFYLDEECDGTVDMLL